LTLKSIVFAVEATSRVGAGHVMRCLGYSSELRRMGHQVLFWGDCDLPWILEDHRYQKVSDLGEQHSVDLLVLDSYENSFLERAVDSFLASKTLQFLDSNNTSLFCTDVVWLDDKDVDQDLVSGLNMIASGLSFFAIRDFGDLLHTHEAKEVIITLGGSQASLHLDAIIDVLMVREFENLAFHFFVPEGFHNRLPSNFHTHPFGVQLDNVASYCDTAITASGTSLWDFVGNRRIVGHFPIAKNQLSNFNFAFENHMAVSIGGGILEDGLDLEAIRRLFFDVNLRKELSQFSTHRPDRKGVVRLANAINYFLK
jgi:spore coat polysaccharide biosynthesis predicted glycosyltransferase SpsG